LVVFDFFVFFFCFFVFFFWGNVLDVLRLLARLARYFVGIILLMSILVSLWDGGLVRRLIVIWRCLPSLSMDTYIRTVSAVFFFFSFLGA